MKDSNLKNFFNSSDLLFCVANKDGFFTELNPSWSKLLGWTVQELKSKPFIEFVHPLDIEKTIQEASRLAEDPNNCINFTNRYLTKKGGYKTLSWNTKVIDEVFFCIVKDISNEAKNIQAIEKTSEVAKIGTWELDLLDQSMHWSDETFKIHGYDAERPQLALEEGINFYHPDSRQLIEKTVSKAIENGTGWDIEAQLITIQGQKKWVRTIGFVEKSCDGSPIRLYGTFQDIDELKKSKDLFSQKNELLNLTLFNSKMGLWEFSPSGKALMFDSFWSKSTGLLWDKNPVDWEILADRLLEPSKTEFTKQINNLISRKTQSLDLEVQIKCRNQEIKYMHLQGKFKDKIEQRDFLGVYQDISDKKELEKSHEEKRVKLIHTSKMSTLGEMAGGIAHEINNPLAILSNLFSMKDSKDPLQLEMNAMGIDAIERISFIIKNLKNFSKEDSPKISEHRLLDVVSNSLALHNTKIENSNINLIIDIDANMTVLCSPVKLNQAIFNLIQNSISALKESPKKEIRITGNQEAGKTLLRITDTGPGIPQNIRHKIFDPFFTTKDYGSGSGLGLSSAKGLIESLGGSINLEKESATNFLITLKS